MRDNVAIISNFFDAEDAKNIMSYLDKLESEGIMSERSFGRVGIENSEDPYLKKYVNFYQKKVNDHFNDGFNKLAEYTMNIYKTGVGMDMHFDAKQGTEMGALLYLNDNYLGGELIVEDNFKYKPKELDLVYYPTHLMHGVATVTEGKRYMIGIFCYKGDVISLAMY
jgi:hypothetical protein